MWSCAVIPLDQLRLRLADHDFERLMQAARPLQVSDRDAFLKDVAAELGRHEVVGPGLLHRVIGEVQQAGRSLGSKGPARCDISNSTSSDIADSLRFMRRLTGSAGTRRRRPCCGRDSAVEARLLICAGVGSSLAAISSSQRRRFLGVTSLMARARRARASSVSWSTLAPPWRTDGLEAPGNSAL